MTETEMRELFEQHDACYLDFDDVQSKRSKRPDLHAFILLDTLVPSDRDMVCSAEHDEIFLEVSLSELAAVISEDQIIELIRCGVRCSYEGLSMFA